MSFFEKLEHIQQLHALIEAEKTGTPEQLATRLRICRKTLYNVIDELESLGASILYSRERETFYYSKIFNLKLICTVEIIESGDLTRINGGGYSFLLPCVFLHGRDVIL
jgi:biotin operon repressor